MAGAAEGKRRRVGHAALPNRCARRSFACLDTVSVVSIASSAISFVRVLPVRPFIRARRSVVVVVGVFRFVFIYFCCLFIRVLSRYNRDSRRRVHISASVGPLEKRVNGARIQSDFSGYHGPVRARRIRPL